MGERRKSEPRRAHGRQSGARYFSRENQPAHYGRTVAWRSVLTIRAIFALRPDTRPCVVAGFVGVPEEKVCQIRAGRVYIEEHRRRFQAGPDPATARAIIRRDVAAFVLADPAGVRAMLEELAAYEDRREDEQYARRSRLRRQEARAGRNKPHLENAR